jgi:hypothetical protein
MTGGGDLEMIWTAILLGWIGAVSIGISGCTVYDPSVGEQPAAALDVEKRVVRVCGEATEFRVAEAELAATGLFGSVKPCTQPFDEPHIGAQVSRPYFDKDVTAVTFVLMVVSAGAIPWFRCNDDLAFDFYLGGSAAPVKVVPQRATCILYGWLPPLLVPLDAFHLGQTPDISRAAEALRAAILAEWPSGNSRAGDSPRGPQE